MANSKPLFKYCSECGWLLVGGYCVNPFCSLMRRAESHEDRTDG